MENVYKGTYTCKMILILLNNTTSKAIAIVQVLVRNAYTDNTVLWIDFWFCYKPVENSNSANVS